MCDCPACSLNLESVVSSFVFLQTHLANRVNLALYTQMQNQSPCAARNLLCITVRHNDGQTKNNRNQNKMNTTEVIAEQPLTDEQQLELLQKRIRAKAVAGLGGTVEAVMEEIENKFSDLEKQSEKLKKILDGEDGRKTYNPPWSVQAKRKDTKIKDLLENQGEMTVEEIAKATGYPAEKVEALLNLEGDRTMFGVRPRTGKVHVLKPKKAKA